MLGVILPAEVATAEAFRDLPESQAALSAGELEAVRGAVPSRRREFATTRFCARKALAALGRPSAEPLRPDAAGAPQWPHGVVGSLTHCAGYRAAAVALTPGAAGGVGIAGIGIDAEPHRPLTGGLLETVARPEELDRLAALTRWEPQVHWDRLLFSAKESVFKVWYPLARGWLGFEEASVAVTALTPGTGLLTVSLLRQSPGLPAVLKGRWLVAFGLVLTAVVLPGPSAPSHGEGLVAPPGEGGDEPW